MVRLFLFLLSFLLIAQPVSAASADAAYYHKAFAAIAAGNADQAEAFASRGSDPVLNKVIRGYAMALPGNDYSFEQLNNFIEDNPVWPCLKGIQMIAEQKIPANASPAQVVAWFSVHPPITLVGFYRTIDALNQTGQAHEAQNEIRLRWIDGNFSGDEQTAYFARFQALLDNSDMWARENHLLWKNNEAEARRMMPYLNSTDRVVAEARLALSAQDRNVESLVSRVPSDARNEPGLLYQLLRWRVKNNQDDDANEMLLNSPTDLGNGDAWWEQRQIMIRRSIEHRDFAMAYRLAVRHGELEAKSFVQAEFLCGWLALRFLDKPDIARQHFQNLYDNASTPISRARGAYWLGRSYEVLGDRNSAEQAYEDAAVFNTTFYGQLAQTRIYSSPTLTAKSDPPLPEAVRHTYMNRDYIRAIMRLTDIGEAEHARAFFHMATEHATERAEFIVLTEVAQHMQRPDLGIQAVKAANQKNILVETGGFPLINLHVPTPPESAFTHALIRQESMFNPEAGSSVGAQGLMQLMPRTAKDVAKKIGIRYSEARLLEPEYNLRLGTSFVQQQIEHFDGSYILALAGYNAGPGRVHEWIEEFGDPRSTNVDPVDWIELIPMQETRNYVQRIIESLQVYRAKLAGGKAQLLIINDLKR